MKRNTRSFAVVLFIIAVFFVSVTFISAMAPGQNEVNATHSVTLVVENAHPLNGSGGSQFMFYQLVNGDLVSSSVITVPAATEIEITIINYDNGTSPPLVQSATNVSGVVGNSIHVYNSTSVSQADLASSSGFLDYSAVPAADLSHTFSTDTGINIPILPHSTETAHTYFQTTGTFSWACLCQCGMLSMETPGWMMGQIVVVPP